MPLSEEEVWAALPRAPTAADLVAQTDPGELWSRLVPPLANDYQQLAQGGVTPPLPAPESLVLGPPGASVPLPPPVKTQRPPLPMPPGAEQADLDFLLAELARAESAAMVRPVELPPEPIAAPVPPGEVEIGEPGAAEAFFVPQSRLDVLAGKPVPIHGAVELQAYLPRRVDKAGQPVPLPASPEEALGGASLGPHRQARIASTLTAIEARRAGELLGPTPDAMLAKARGETLAAGGAPQGLLDPLVARAAWSLNTDGLHPAAMDRGVRRLTGLVLEKDVPTGTYHVKGVDFEKIKAIAGQGQLDLRQSILLLGLATRATTESFFADLLNHPAVQKELAMRPASLDYQADRPESQAAAYEQARSLAFTSIKRIAGALKGDAPAYLRLEADPKTGEIDPATYAEDPAYWDLVATKEPPGKLAARAAELAAHDGDPYLAAKLLLAYEDRKALPDFDWVQFVTNVPASFGRSVVGVAQLYLALPTFLAGTARTLVDMAVFDDKTPRDLQNQLLAEADVAKAEVKGLLQATGKDWVLAARLSAGLPLTRDERKTLLEWQDDPLRPVWTALLTNSVASKVVGGATRAARAQAGSRLAELAKGLKEGSPAWNAVVSLRNLLGGPMRAGYEILKTEAVQRRAKRLTAKTLKDLGMPPTQDLTVAWRAAKEELAKAVNAGADRATLDAVGASVEALGELQRQAGQLHAAFAGVLKDHGLGRLIRNWVVSPSKIAPPTFAYDFVKSMAGKGMRQAYEALRDMEKGVANLKNLGMPEAESRLAAWTLMQNMGDFVGLGVWDVARPYGQMAEAVAKAAAQQGGAFRVGPFAYRLQDLVKAGEHPGPVIEGLLARNLARYVAQVKVPADFGEIVTDLSRRHGLTPWQAARQWIVAEMDRVRDQTRPAAAGEVPLDTMAAGQAGAELLGGRSVGKPKVFHDQATGRRWFDWYGKEYAIERTAGPGKPHFTVKSEGFEFPESTAPSAIGARNNFLALWERQRGNETPALTPALQLPEVTGVSPEALKFGLAVQWALGEAGVKVGGAEGARLGGFYQALLDHSPALRALPKEGWLRHSVALHLMRELQPALTFQEMAGKTMRFMRDGALQEMPVATYLKEMGEPVQNLSRTAYDVGLKMADLGLLKLDQVMNYSLEHLHRIARENARSPGGLQETLKRFANEPQGYSGIPLAERRAYVKALRAELDRQLGAEKKTKTTPEPAAPSEWEGMTAAAVANLMPGGNLLKARKILPGVKLAGETGRRVVDRVWETGKEAWVQARAGLGMMNDFCDMLSALRGEAEHGARVLRELTSNRALTPEVRSYVQERLSRTVNELSPIERMTAAVDLLRQAQAVAVPEAVAPELARALKAAGLKKLSFGPGAELPAWAKEVYLSPEAELHVTRGRRATLPGADNKVMQVLGRITQYIKQNQIVYQTGNWVRDYLSNRFLLGPANDLSPASHAWEMGPYLADSSNAVSGALRAQGLQGGMLTEAGYLGGNAPPGLRAQWRKMWAEVQRDWAGMKKSDTPALDKAAYLLKAAAKLTFAPSKTLAGKFGQYQRAFTDFIPRSVLTVQRISKLLVDDLEWQAELASIAKDAGVPVSKGSFVRPWAREEGPLKTINAAAAAEGKRAYQEARKSQSKGKSREAAWAARVAVYDRAFSKAWQRLTPEQIDGVIGEARKGFVDYDDKSRALEALSKNPFGPIYLTYSVKSLPMLAAWAAKKPLEFLGVRMLHNVLTATMYHAAGGHGSAHDYEQTVPYWQLPMPLGTEISFGTGLGPTELPAAIDMAALTSGYLGPDTFNPALSPFGALLLEFGQLFGDRAPRSMFPRATGPESTGGAGGPPLTQEHLGGGEKALQFLLSEWSKFAPGLNLVQAAQYGAARAGLPTGPGPAGMRGTTTTQPFLEALHGSASGTAAVPGLEGAIARAVGLKIIPAGEKAAARTLVAGELVTQQERARAEELGLDKPPSRSVIGFAVDYVRDVGNLQLNRWETENAELARKVGPQPKGKLLAGASEHVAELRLKTAAYDAAKATFEAVKGKLERVGEDLQTAVMFEYLNTPIEQRFLKTDQVQKTLNNLRGETADRLEELLEEAYQNRTPASPERLQWALQPIGEAWGIDVTVEAATGQTKEALDRRLQRAGQRTLRALDAEETIDFAEAERAKKAGRPYQTELQKAAGKLQEARAAQQDYQQSAGRYPEALIRAGVKRQVGLTAKPASEPIIIEKKE